MRVSFYPQREVQDNIQMIGLAYYIYRSCLSWVLTLINMRSAFTAIMLREIISIRRHYLSSNASKE